MQMMDEMGNLDGMKVINVTNGSGTTALMLAERSKKSQIVCVCFNDRLMKAAREKTRRKRNIRFLPAGDGYFDISDEKFDAAVSAFNIGNFNDPVRAIEELYRVLRRGGRLFVLDLNKPQNTVLRGLWELNYSLKVTPLVNSGIQRQFNGDFDIKRIRVDRDGIVDILKATGFAVKKVRNLSFGTAFVIVGEKI